jgi:muramoyltetrapeptide carboxypeptidase
MPALPKKPIRPQRLAAGALIGVAAPAGAVDRDALQTGLARLETFGFRVRVQKEVFLNNGYLAGDDRLRADSINALIRDRRIKAVICARGGYGCMRILPLIDYAALQKDPKPIVGFSDVTALLAAVYAKSDVSAIHGPVVTSLATADAATADALKEILTGNRAVRLGSAGGPVFAPGICRGPVLAGNLTLLCHLVGTPYSVVPNGHILLIEDQGEARYRIDRMLTHLLLAGYFDHVAGIALGSFNDCGDSDALNDVFFERLTRLGIPVLGGFEVGHGTRNLPLPVGLPATLDADRGTLAFDSPATSEC